jgi:hypothetical protein
MSQIYRRLEAVNNPEPRKNFFAAHVLVSAALLLLAIGVAAGTYIYFRPNVVIDSVPPFVHNKPVAIADWKTYTDPSGGFEFRYPDKLSATYISTQTWPPMVKISNGAFTCSPTTDQNATKMIRRTNTKPEFCAIMQPEGTAGTTYNKYTYTAASGTKLVTFDFTLGLVDCGVYLEPKNTSCVVEQKAFSVDKLMEQIFATFKLTGAVSTADWRTYTNSQYGFEFKYPKDMVVTTSTPSGRFNAGVNFSVGLPDSKWMYGVDIEANSTNLNLDQVFNENYLTWKNSVTQYSDFQLKDFSTADLTINGVKAKQLYINNFGDVGSTMVSVVHNGNIYMIAGGGNKGDLDPFLSTFKFTK